MSIITSTDNPAVKQVRRLQTNRRFREREGVYVVEGTRWLSELVALSRSPRGVYYTPEWAARPEHQQLLAQLDGPQRAVSQTVMAAMSDNETPPGVLALLPIEPLPWPERPTLLLILDRVRNPGNLGTICRTAAAAAVDGVLLGPGCVDFYNPKVVRGGMGAHLRLPVQAVSWEEIAARTAGLSLWLADIGGTILYNEVDWRQPAGLVIGGEAHGPGDMAQKVATGRISIPMSAATESLNAAVAAGVILFEAVRQRRLAVPSNDR